MLLKRIALVALAFIMSASTALAAFPEKEITLLVPWGAGGPTDIAARAFAPLLEKHLGKSVVVAVGKRTRREY